ncbi:periplasmic binding protein-like II [Penicillium manginii]|uniref:periplasmic binding protein-like II n=1 Tax=Penicillium manginii TaxID=203109 RepID=UPI002548C990|nr:periplasmic binding protein-like II [Penicillium manginii]KAJ5744076.1 periplasmic binding protein-like II [Penicillium manginii]
MQPFHITATGYSLNYLPEYIALRHGFFREQGLDVTVHIPTPWDGVLDALADGSATMCLGGIWVPSMYRERVQNYTVFTQIASRAPLALIRRASDKSFNLSEVTGRTVLINSGGGGSFGLFFKMLLRENGIDAKSVDYIQDLNGEMLGNLFQGGMGDYFVTDNLSALAMVTRNPDLSIAMQMVTQGDVPWSVYYRETATITPEILNAQKRFCIALQKGIDWVLLHDAESFQDELSELFPSVPIDVVVSVTNDFRHNGMWVTTSVPRDGYDRWQLGLRDARLVKEPIVYEDLVDNTPSAAALTIAKASTK